MLCLRLLLATTTESQRAEITQLIPGQPLSDWTERQLLSDGMGAGIRETERLSDSALARHWREMTDRMLSLYARGDIDELAHQEGACAGSSSSSPSDSWTVTADGIFPTSFPTSAGVSFGIAPEFCGFQAVGKRRNTMEQSGSVRQKSRNISGVASGIRTRDLMDHNHAL